MSPNDYLRCCGIILFTQDSNLCRQLADGLPDRVNLCCVHDKEMLPELVVAPVFQVLISDTSDSNPEGMSCLSTVRNISSIGLMALVAPDTPEQRIVAYRAGAETCVGRYAGMCEICAVLRNLCRRMQAARGATFES